MKPGAMFALYKAAFFQAPKLAMRQAPIMVAAQQRYFNR